MVFIIHGRNRIGNFFLREVPVLIIILQAELSHESYVTGRYIPQFYHNSHSRARNIVMDQLDWT
jgi:hypothetical protein